MVQEMYRNGILTEEQAKKHPDRHTLSQYLGMKEEEILPEAYLANPIAAKSGDICLLCSDGLTEMLNEEQICEILCRKLDLKKKAEQLIEAALDQEGKDNITISLLEAE
jgi:protein phosphatase